MYPQRIIAATTLSDITSECDNSRIWLPVLRSPTAQCNQRPFLHHPSRSLLMTRTCRMLPGSGAHAHRHHQAPPCGGRSQESLTAILTHMTEPSPEIQAVVDKVKKKGVRAQRLLERLDPSPLLRRFASAITSHHVRGTTAGRQAGSAPVRRSYRTMERSQREGSTVQKAIAAAATTPMSRPNNRLCAEDEDTINKFWEEMTRVSSSKRHVRSEAVGGGGRWSQSGGQPHRSLKDTRLRITVCGHPGGTTCHPDWRHQLQAADAVLCARAAHGAPRHSLMLRHLRENVAAVDRSPSNAG